MSEQTEHALAIDLCNNSEKHAGGAGRHNATAWGPCSIHIRAAAEIYALLNGADERLHSTTALPDDMDELAQRLGALRATPDEPTWADLIHDLAELRRQSNEGDPRTHGLNHAPLPEGMWLAPGFCAGCDEERPRSMSELGCDCTELCGMGPTCPGGILARLPGAGCASERPEGGIVSGEVPDVPVQAQVLSASIGDRAECATCSGRGVWMDEPCGDCHA